MIELSLSTGLAASVRDAKKAGMIEPGEPQFAGTGMKRATSIYEGTITLPEVTPQDDNWY